MHDLGCFELLKERLGFDWSLQEIYARVGRRWRIEQIVELIKSDFGGVEAARPQRGDIVISGNHIGLYNGAGWVEHRIKGRRVLTPMERYGVTRIIAVPGRAD